MSENNKIKYTTYLAGAIESVSSKEMKSWRKEITEKLSSPDLGIYDPVEQESNKVGKESGKQVEYISGLKQGGHWDIFTSEMQKIWWGKIDTTKLDKIRLLIYLQEKARLEGNYLTDFCVDRKTQAITELGEVKYFYELKIGDKIATFNKKTKQIEFSPIRKLFINNNYNHLIYCLHRKNKKFYFSPNHNILYQWHNKEEIKENKIGELYKLNRKFNIPIWNAIECREIYSENEIKIIAWILSEGSVHLTKKWKKPYKKFGSCNLYICQKKSNPNVNLIRKILQDLNIKFIESIQNNQTIFTILAESRDYIFNLLEIKDKNWKKQIPSWIYTSSLNSRKLFIEEFLKGDGHIRKNEKVLYFGEKSLLKNNFIRLFLKSGIMFRLIKLKSGFNKNKYNLNILQNKQCSFTFDKPKKYKGTIWCPTTDNGTWIAFREGIPFITGNCYWADYEATVRSDFIIVYYPKEIKTVGTLNEVHTCYLFNIPIYLILPDHPKTEANSTLINEVMESKGEIFYSINECCNFIKEKYKLKYIEAKKNA